ncbi:hypothetical protein OEZ85_000761 [Tetradesmus obliquus]|uniref:HAUS augmin-like complex subunit 3 N-terminal domain-containing protein n=1 Tax=Tetradesmus obliquus TaxID=3088 RepID=A0ABY8UJL6_TETOB|nr:hypothetical protein OEZ85_000761 [Tetradesmus obliquus]
MQQLGWAGAELQEQMRDATLALACDVLEALQQEQQQLLQAILQQIEAYVCSLHGAAAEDEQFCLEHLCELGAPEASALVDWLYDKVDMLSQPLPVPGAAPTAAAAAAAAAGAIVQGPAGYGDWRQMEQFVLSEDGSRVAVNLMWLQKLQSRVLDSSGSICQPQPGQDPKRVGLVLEWLYADAFNDALTAIVPFMAQSTLFSNSSTAQQTSQQVLNQLVQCLQQQAQLTVQLEQAKQHIRSILQFRQQFGAMQPLAQDVLPAAEGLMMFLQRQQELLAAKLFAAEAEQHLAVSNLKAVLERMKLASFGLDCRVALVTPADKHRAKLPRTEMQALLAALRKQQQKMEALQNQCTAAEMWLDAAEAEALRANEPASNANLQLAITSMLERLQGCEQQGKATTEDARCAAARFTTTN